MTTFTIDMPLKMKKTHFASPLEAIFFLSQIGLKKKEEKTPLLKKILKEYEKKQDIMSLDSYMKKRGLTK